LAWVWGAGCCSCGYGATLSRMHWRMMSWLMLIWVPSWPTATAWSEDSLVMFTLMVTAPIWTSGVVKLALAW